MTDANQQQSNVDSTNVGVYLAEIKGMIAVLTMRQELLEKTVSTLTERRPPAWPAMVSTIINAVMFVLFIAALLYKT